MTKNGFVKAAGVFCASAALLLCGCERHDTSTPQGAAQDTSDSLRGTARDTLAGVTNSNTTAEIKRGARDAAAKVGDAVKDAGRSLENAGEKLKEKSQ